jgi:dimeric dUTPase (all-alpha-NTP-PPase superfamily)
VVTIGLYQKIIDEAIPHTPLEAEMAKQIDKLNDKIEQLEKRMPRSLAQQMDAIGKLPNGSIHTIW